MLRFIWPAALLLGCVPEGIQYPNPTDGGTSPDAETMVDGDAGPPGDSGGVPDSGPAGQLVIRAGGVPVDPGGTFDFGPLGVGGTRTVVFTIDNGTAAAVTLTGSPPVAISGAGAAAFTATPPSATSVAPGASADFSIAAAPTATGPLSAAVSVAYDGGAYDFSVSVTGRPPGVWVGVGNNGRRALSLDGAAWSNEQTFGGSDDSNLFRTVGFGNGVFVAAGGGQNGLLYWSENGVDWTDASDTLGWFGGIAFGNGMFLAVGSNGRYLTSTNGKSWGGGDRDFAQHFRAVAFGNGEFVLVGDEGRRTSTTNGADFTPTVLGGDRLTAVVYTGDRFVAVGLNGRRVVSMDGESWMFDQIATDGLGFFDVAYGNGRVIAVGGIGVVVSEDGGETWTQDRGAPLMNALTYGNGQFVGTGDFDGVVFTSGDGVSWTRHDNAGPAGFTKIAYGE